MAYRCAKCGGDGDLSLGGRHDERGDWIPVFVEGDQPYGFQGPCGDLHVFVETPSPKGKKDDKKSPSRGSSSLLPSAQARSTESPQADRIRYPATKTCRHRAFTHQRTLDTTFSVVPQHQVLECSAPIGHGRIW